MVHPAQTDVDTVTDSEFAQSDLNSGTQQVINHLQQNLLTISFHQICLLLSPSLRGELISLSFSLSLSDEDHDVTLIGAEVVLAQMPPLPKPGP